MGTLVRHYEHVHFLSVERIFIMFFFINLHPPKKYYKSQFTNVVSNVLKASPPTCYNYSAFECRTIKNGLNITYLHWMWWLVKVISSLNFVVDWLDCLIGPHDKFSLL